MSVLLIVAKIAAVGIVALTPAQADLSTITVNRIVQLTNAERTKIGLNELAVSPLLASAAQQKGEHMLEEDYFAHISPSGVTPWFWINKVGYAYLVAGENLAIDFTEAEDVVAAWMASPTHKENMLHSEYTETGVAVVTGEFQGGTSTVVVHMFGKPLNEKVAAESATLTPTPEATVAPTPAPITTPVPTPPPDSTPPRIPRIVLSEEKAVVQKAVSLQLESEEGSTVYILLNSQTRGSAVVLDTETLAYELGVDDVPDGRIVLRAYAVDRVGNKSELSDPLIVTKDTAGPKLAREELTFILSPQIDRVQAAAKLPEGEYDLVQLAYGQPKEVANHEKLRLVASWLPVSSVQDSFNLTVFDEAGNHTTLDDIALSPQFDTDMSLKEREIQVPARVSRFSRRLSASVGAALVLLLLLAILIRAHIQRPGLITHASLVIALASVLLFL